MPVKNSLVNLNKQAIELTHTRKPGQTGIWRNAVAPEALTVFPIPDVTTLYDMFENVSMKKHAKRPYLGHRPYDPVTDTYGRYMWQTYETIAERRTNFGSGLLHLNEHVIKAKDVEKWTVGVIANNRPEWMIVDQACVAYNLITVPLYETLGPDTIEFVTRHAELRVIITSSDHVPNLLSIADKLKNCKVIISMDCLSSGKKPAIGTMATEQALKAWARDKNVLLIEFEEVETLGKENPRPHNPPKPSDLFTLSYTSGTTGDPKGAMISHKNMVVASCGAGIFWPLYHTDVMISYLPLAHIYGRIMDWTATLYSASIGYFRGDVLLLLEDISMLKPTIFPSVPRLLNKIYSKLKAATVSA
ncbi:hypothetical protein BC936DRAFT_140812 [Jimgerdemannia flammicorona]|uniref:Uncharacterized protein n=2 Tax=Jimgerdemannia flammicorona TaxID=994334 RepID=A0A433A3E9_9FUNG|nr:hypothetical protein BC936DRAFT_140812 [Jimgerdemannia flammicorona]RUS34313.1 hypothetical protein BC938DRAFT_481271 [Jimgerdemannia flammicorona]